MNPRERILTALNNKQPDRVPIFELHINKESIVSLAELLLPGSIKEKTGSGEEDLAALDLYLSLVRELDLDATTTQPHPGLEVIGPGLARDRYGSLYHLSSHGEPLVSEGPIKTPEDVRGFDMASKLKRSDFSRVRYVIEKAGKNKAHFVNVNDPFKLSWQLTGGMQNLLMHYITYPRLVHDLARLTTDFCIAAIELAQQAGADVIAIPGDLAGEQDLIISPVHYREYVKPYHKLLVDHAHKLGLKIVKHSDGNMWPILDDFVEVGFDGIHPFQPQCMDIGEAKRYLAGKACILGNIDCRNLLVFGTPEEVEETVRKTIEVAAPGGGYILSSSNSIHPDCKPENYIAMIKAAHKYGEYR